jgi:hypothetical protein
MKRPEAEILEDIRLLYRGTYPNVIYNLAKKIEELQKKAQKGGAVNQFEAMSQKKDQVRYLRISHDPDVRRRMGQRPDVLHR